MILLNFSHLLTAVQVEQLTALLGEPPTVPRRRVGNGEL